MTNLTLFLLASMVESWILIQELDTTFSDHQVVVILGILSAAEIMNRLWF